MPVLFFVRDGTGDDHTSGAHQVSAVSVSHHLAGIEKRFSVSGPTINGDRVASPFSPYRHVVLEILDGETSQDYPRAGFYYLVGFTPAEARALFGIGEP